MIDFFLQILIEILFRFVMDGQFLIGLFMKVFVVVEVVLQIGSLVILDGSGFDFLLFDKQGVLYVVVFIDLLCVGVYNQQVLYMICMLMIEVLCCVFGGYGVVVNLGIVLGFELLLQGIGEILKDFG